MKISLKEFKKRFIDDFIEIHWRQWSALGVSSYVEPENNWLIDLEALIVSTLNIGLEDMRLLNSATEWILKYKEWISFQRLKRILKLYIEIPENQNNKSIPMLNPDAAVFLGKILSNESLKNWIVNKSGAQEKQNTQYEKILKNFQVRGITTEPILTNPPSLQLKLRAIFGTDARSEVMLYFLTQKRGNSNSIAKKVYYDQKGIYRILVKWSKAGILTTIKGSKEISYALEKKERWLTALDIEKIPSYLDWVKTLRFFNIILNSISQKPFSEDEYLLSSLFRDISGEAKSIGECFDISFPECSRYSGEEYFSPFAMRILEIFEIIKNYKKRVE